MTRLRLSAAAGCGSAAQGRREGRRAARVDLAPGRGSGQAPVEELARLLGQLKHAVDVLGVRVEDAELDGPLALAWSRVMREYRLALDGAARLGLKERQVRISEQTGGLLAGLVHRVLLQLELTPEQQALAATVVPSEFRALASGQVVQGEVE